MSPSEPLCRPYDGPSTPNLDTNSLYCLTPNTINSPAITNLVQSCCASNPLQKLGGCDFCVIDTPTYWSQNSADGTHEYGRAWASCLSFQSRDFNVTGGRFSACNVPNAAAGIGSGTPSGWGVWGVVVVVGFHFISGGLA
jgi:hypothetical protein